MKIGPLVAEKEDAFHFSSVADMYCYHVVIICYLGDVWSRSNTQPLPIATTTGNSLWFFKNSNLLETLAVLSHVFFYYKAVKITIMLLTRSKIERIQLEVPKKT